MTHAAVSATDPSDSVLRVYWFLPAAFLVHDIEELRTAPSWVIAHHSQLAAFVQRIGLAATVVDRLPTSLPALAGGVGILLVLFIGITWGATHARGRGPWQFAYAALLGGFYVHGFTHLGQALYFAGYTPGSVTAALVVIPVSLYLYTRLIRARLLAWKTAMVAALFGTALFIPTVLLALTAGSWLAHH